MSIDVKEALRQRDVLRDMLVESMRYCESSGIEIGDRYGLKVPMAQWQEWSDMITLADGQKKKSK